MQNMNTNKKILILCLPLLLSACKESRIVSPMPSGVSVKVMQIDDSRVQYEQNYSGTVEAGYSVPLSFQTAGNLERLYPGTDRIEIEDTAIAARYLAEGRLSDDTAVVCRRNAGEMFGLRMVHENIEDRSDNMTEFHLLHKRRSG